MDFLCNGDAGTGMLLDEVKQGARAALLSADDEKIGQLPERAGHATAPCP